MMVLLLKKKSNRWIEKEKAEDGLEKETHIGWNLNLEKWNGLKKAESLVKMLN